MSEFSEFSASRVKFRQARNYCKKDLEAAKLAYANKKRLSLPRNLALVTFVFSTRVNLIYLKATPQVTFLDSLENWLILLFKILIIIIFL